MKQYTFVKYQPSDAISSLINENSHTLLVLSRFNIALGFGDRNIGEVCRANSVDVNTFLAIINLMGNDNKPVLPVKSPVSIECLINYLYHSHQFFLNFRLPEMRRKFVAALNESEEDLNRAVLVYFDNFVAALKKHTQNEDKKIFPYVQDLLKGKQREKLPVVLSKQHEQIQTRLTEFKNVLIKYYPANKANEINSFLFDVFNCEKDLASHNAVEEYLFQPAIDELENRNNSTTTI
ncbi:MAG: hemerythrin domain-containing protein [Dysgonamonadaceae bacterium]|jgi:regulator of cell morphogenesis and NO signaling|nr:hemerythrin domain-containing protein [Dysgonamonadaceae bacterium]